MKAISLWQPWASALVSGAKTIETRHWPTSYRGPLLIHAAKYHKECDAYQARTLPFGALVGLVYLIGCKPVEAVRDTISEQEYSLGNYEDGRFAWITERGKVFETAIDYKGQQGFFEVPEEVVSCFLTTTAKT